MNQPANQLPASNNARRVASVDVLRGLTILLMVFVNDLGQSAPAWMHHIQPPDADGMTLADIVFPFFLFIAGVSIPLAFDAARRRGESNCRILGHILSRTLALILMGLIEVNRQNDVLLGPELWGLLAFVSIICAWCIVPRTPGRRRNVFLALKMLGIVGVVILFAMFRSQATETDVLFFGHVTEWTWIRTQWWGILGLIGWAYLVAASVYFLLAIGGGRPRPEWLMAAVAMLILMFLASKQGGFFVRVADKTWLEPLLPVVASLESVVEFVNRHVDLGTQLGSLPSIMMAGCILGSVLLHGSEIESAGQRVRWSLTFAAILFLLGLMTDTFAGINKISATPTWCLWCAAMATLVWVVLYWVIDIRQWSAWTILVRPAGANPLIAYLMHPILLFVLSLTGLGTVVRSYADSPTSLVAMAGSLAMALFVCGFTGLIAKCGLRIRV